MFLFNLFSFFSKKRVIREPTLAGTSMFFIRGPSRSLRPAELTQKSEVETYNADNVIRLPFSSPFVDKRTPLSMDALNHS